MSGTASHKSAISGGYGSLKSYVIGFVLSVILTAIPFWLVLTNILGSGLITSIVIVAFAVLQIVVHVRCFLHVDATSEEGWTLMSFVFTIVMVLIVMMGSIWVMYNLNNNMMPMTTHQAKQLP